MNGSTQNQIFWGVIPGHAKLKRFDTEDQKAMSVWCFSLDHWKNFLKSHVYIESQDQMSGVIQKYLHRLDWLLTEKCCFFKAIHSFFPCRKNVIKIYISSSFWSDFKNSDHFLNSGCHLLVLSAGASEWKKWIENTPDVNSYTI